jgi:hypothetical protein
MCFFYCVVSVSETELMNWYKSVMHANNFGMAINFPRIYCLIQNNYNASLKQFKA